MLFIEYDWTFDVYRFRIGSNFSDFRGVRYLESLRDWREYLAEFGVKVGPKTASRTWRVTGPSDD